MQAGNEDRETLAGEVLTVVRGALLPSRCHLRPEQQVFHDQDLRSTSFRRALSRATLCARAARWRLASTAAAAWRSFQAASSSLSVCW